jgi:hypothetical protein
VSLWKNLPVPKSKISWPQRIVPAMYFAFRKMAAGYYGKMNGMTREDEE